MLTKEPKIVYQGVDTLVTSHKITCEHSYNTLFKPFLNLLEQLKKNAQKVDGYDKKSRFVVHEIPYLGKTKIFAQGGGRYSYQLENQDIFMEVAEADFESDTPQIRVRYSNHFLFFCKVDGAYQKVMDFVSLVLGSDSKNIISEIHLCTDVMGVVYEQEDKLRFQTRLNLVEYNDMQSFSFRNHVKGIYFGKGAFLFRIYDKNKDLQNHPEHSFVKQVWYLNGYDEFEVNIIKKSVYRHEIQFRREYLKKYLADIDDEPLFFFQHLDKLWFHVLEKIEFVNLTDDELYRVKTSLKPDTIRQIFYRAKQDDERFFFWDILRSWLNNLESGSLDMYPAFKEAKLSTLKKLIKQTVSTAARLGLSQKELADLVCDIDSKLQHFEGISLHQYGELKVIDSFAHNERVAHKFNIPAPQNVALIQYSYNELAQAFVNYDVLANRKEFKSASKFLGEDSELNIKIH